MVFEPVHVEPPEMADNREWTAVELERALEATRSEHNGITLDFVARIICKAFDAAEVRSLLNSIERYRTDI